MSIVVRPSALTAASIAASSAAKLDGGVKEVSGANDQNVRCVYVCVIPCASNELVQNTDCLRHLGPVRMPS